MSNKMGVFVKLFKVFKALKQLKYVNPWKTLYVNFYYFPLKTAIQTPVFVCWRTKIKELGGNVILPSVYWRGMFRFGSCKIGILDSFFYKKYLGTIGNTNN